MNKPDYLFIPEATPEMREFVTRWLRAVADEVESGQGRLTGYSVCSEMKEGDIEVISLSVDLERPPKEVT